MPDEIKNWIKIRRAKAEDTETLWELDKRCFSLPWSREDFARDLNDNILSTYLVAEADSMIIADVGIWVVLDECHIMTIAVEPDWQKQGIGTMLMLEILRYAREAGATSYTLEVRRSNKAAIALYEKFGFTISGYRRSYYEDNKEDAAIMWKYDL